MLHFNSNEKSHEQKRKTLLSRRSKDFEQEIDEEEENSSPDLNVRHPSTHIIDEPYQIDFSQSMFY